MSSVAVTPTESQAHTSFPLMSSKVISPMSSEDLLATSTPHVHVTPTSTPDFTPIPPEGNNCCKSVYAIFMGFVCAAELCIHLQS